MEFITDGLPDLIVRVVREIVKRYQPEQIYLYNRKQNTGNELTGFKLCVILRLEDRDWYERDIYLRIDSEVPFDILLYTPEEWDMLSCKAGSFAARIRETGMMVYG